MKRLIFFCLLLLTLPVLAQDGWTLNTELDESIELTEVVGIPTSGFKMNYPEDWVVQPYQTFIVFSNAEAQLYTDTLSDLESGQMVSIVYPTVDDMADYPGGMDANTVPSTIVSYYASTNFIAGYTQYNAMTVDELNGREISASYSYNGDYDRLVIAIRNGDEISTMIASSLQGEMPDFESTLVAMMNSLAFVEPQECEGLDTFTDVSNITDFEDLLTESYVDVFTDFSYLYPVGWVPCYDAASGFSTLAITQEAFNIDFADYPEDSPAILFIPSMNALGNYDGEMTLEGVSEFWDELGQTQGVYNAGSSLELFTTGEYDAGYFTNEMPGHDRAVILVPVEDDFVVMMAFTASGELDDYIEFFKALAGTVSFED